MYNIHFGGQFENILFYVLLYIDSLKTRRLGDDLQMVASLFPLIFLICLQPKGKIAYQKY